MHEIRQSICLIVIAIACLVASAANSQERCKQPSNQLPEEAPAVSIAVLHRSGAAGELQWQAVEAACNDFGCDDEPRIAITSYCYDTEPEGFRVLQQEIVKEAPEIHQLVIGPGDSGVLLRAREFMKPGNGNDIPVISPVVIAPGSEAGDTSLAPVNDADSSFFTLNVGTDRRAEVVVNFLIRKKMQSVTVLYSDTVFGRLSEAALRSRLQENGIASYTSHRFADQSEAQRTLPAILSNRPAAIGILGLRNEIYGILDDFRQRNSSWNSYRPLFFTVVDVRGLKFPNLYFPTVSLDSGLDQHDNYSLAYDTMDIVVRLIRRNISDDNQFSSSGFKDDLLDVLQGPPENPGHMSGMQFNNYLNQAPLNFGVVINQTGPNGAATSKFVPLDLREPLDFLESTRNIFDVRLRRFGPMLLVNIVFVMVIVGYLTILDMQKWYAGTKRSVIWRPPFLALLGFNLIMALSLYTFLAESRDIRWDSTLEAVVIAFGYAALLKSTVFQTQAGQAIGLGAMYDDTVGWLNDRIMFTKYRTQSGFINFVAYRNSLAFLRTHVEGIFRFAKSKKRNAELIQQLGDRVDAEATILGKRRVYAEQVLTLMSWQDLQNRQVVPPGLNKRHVINPEILVTMSAHHVINTQKEKAKDWLLHCVYKLIDEDAAENPDRGKLSKEKVKEALDNSKTNMGDVYLLVRWLFLHHGARNKDLREAGLLPDNYEKLAMKRHWWNNLPILGRKK